MQGPSPGLHVLLRAPVHCRTQRSRLAPQRCNSNADLDHAPISERLQCLRDEVHAWFKFNTKSFQTIFPPVPGHGSKYVSSERLYLWNHYHNLVAVSSIPSKVSQQTIEHEWSPTTSCPSRWPVKLDVLMDPIQNLFAIVYNVNKTTNIYLATLDDGRVHPHASGPALVLGLPGYSNQVKFKCYGRHIGLRRRLRIGTSLLNVQWQLQIWDWQHSTTSNVSLQVYSQK
jgi:hypothetical protein